jgi:hypothetical protein
MWGSMIFVALAFGGQASPAPPAAVAPPPQVQAARDERPLLWRGLRAGMSPTEVAAALSAQGIRARLATDPATGRQMVETPGRIDEAGRPAEMALGFVDDRLFHVLLSAQRILASRIPFERSHFAHVAGVLEQRFGAPESIDSDFRVSDVGRYGFNASATGRFERDGVRADLSGHDSFATFQADVVEVVNVKYWRIADAEAFAADRARKAPSAEPARE